jgi:hypothetical protein
MNSDYSQRWQKLGDELVTSVPSIPSLPADGNRDIFYNQSEVLVEKGDHIRLQDVSISYEMTKATIKGLPFRSLQIYSYINNIGIIWRANDKKLDPDLYGLSLPIPRTIAFGIRAGF